ncbi:hypothetical protein GIB67_033909 [Kingdonia uniflora]|uniref:Pre-mRNA-splicing factor 18 n=1 Tax=Kingdonia uniflora TaxID=39325 RepID=A0A7J7NC80_9MAGN|nr:hypothetical protein GIB67_033909 [Kingdonia uniflora]
MDLLREELKRKRQLLSEEVGGKKVFKRSEIEEKRIQKLRDQEKRELEAKSKFRSLRDNQNSSTLFSSTPPSSTDHQNPNFNLNQHHQKTPEAPTDEQKIDELVLPKQEVIRRLRFLKQPITLFGEDDDTRLDRLKLILKAGVFEVDSDMTEGQTNDFLRDISELKKRQKTGIVSDRKKKCKEDGNEDGDGGGDNEMSGDGGSSGDDAGDKDLKRLKANYEDLCDEDRILVFFKRLLNEWKQELDDMPEAEKRTAKGKSSVATFKQCARYLHPLFKFCRKKVFLVYL